MPLAAAGKRPRTIAGIQLPRGRLVPIAVGSVLVVIVVIALALSLGGSSPAANSAGTSLSTTTASASPATTATTTATPAAHSVKSEHQAAIALAGLLPQSGADRNDVTAAVLNVQACGKNLAKDARVLTRAADNRRALLAKFAKQSGRSALPAAMVRALTGAWRASATDDADLAKWAAKAAHHCHKGNSNDPNLTASYQYSSQATNDKKAFVRKWNKLAKKYHLRTYQWQHI